MQSQYLSHTNPYEKKPLGKHDSASSFWVSSVSVQNRNRQFADPNKKNTAMIGAMVSSLGSYLKS